MNPFVGRLITAALILVVTLGIGYGALHALAHLQAERARKAWESVLGTRQELVDRYAYSGPNEVADFLTGHARSLGLRFPSSARGDWPERAPDAPRFPREAVADFTDALRRRTQGGIPPIADSLSAYLDETEERIQTLRERLARSEPPRWEVDLTRINDVPSPPLIAPLQTLLMIDAARAAQDGDRSRIDNAVEASRNLSRAFEVHPEVFTQFRRVSMLRAHMAWLRVLEISDPASVDRLRFESIRSDAMNSALVEAWLLAQPSYDLTERSSFNTFGYWNWEHVKKPMFHIARPYWRLSSIDAASNMREQVQELQAREAWCETDLPRIEINSWNQIHAYRWTDWRWLAHRLKRVELELQFTRLVMEQRRAGPRSEFSTVPSPGCPDDHWIIDSEGDFTTIRFSREVSEPVYREGPIPLEFTVRHDEFSVTPRSP